MGGTEQQFTVTLRHVDSYVLRCSPTATCDSRLAASVAALHKLANNVEHSVAAALLRWPRLGNRGCGRRVANSGVAVAAATIHSLLYLRNAFSRNL